MSTYTKESILLEELKNSEDITTKLISNNKNNFTI